MGNMRNRNNQKPKSNNQKPSRGRGGRSSKPKSNKSREDLDSVVEEGRNAVEWYSKSPELLRDAASIPFSWPVGQPLHTSKKIANDVIPGIMTLELTPTVGTSLNENSPVNVAASSIYSWVRHANSGHSNYDAPDLMIYLCAMSNIYSFVTWCQRLYSIMMQYDQKNRYLPKALITANHVSFESLRDNLANFRYWLNTYITKVASLAVPNTMPIFQRLAFLYSNVYIEGPSIKDQLYMYVPYGNEWYKFSLDSDSRGQLELAGITMAVPNRATWEEIRDYGTQLFNAIWEQEDFGIMSGDIIKAYGANLIKLAPIPENFTSAPIFDTMVLHQMKNARFCSHVTVGKISQNANGLIAASIVMDAAANANQKAIQYQDALRDKLLTSDFDNPGPDVVIESTRLIYGYDDYNGVFTSGSEIMRQCYIYSFLPNGTLTAINTLVSSVAWDEGTALPVGQINQFVQRIGWQRMFKYAPEMIGWSVTSNAVNDNKCQRVWEVDNYAVLDNEDLTKMHEAALLSEFAVQAIAKL